MYESHFGLRRRPFRPMPDSDCYYPATTHEHALEQVLQALRHDEGHILLTAEPGLGKTLLAHCLLERLGPQTTSAFVTNSHLSDRTSLLQVIMYELALPYDGRSEQDMRLALTDYLLENFKAGRRALLVVDEAHHLSVDLLEELRLLGNLEARTGKALQVVLLAQPAVFHTLVQPELTALRQRLAIKTTLEPLGCDEAADYLVHHLRGAGGRVEDVIADEALTLLAQQTHGVPRLLNQAAHQALLLTHSVGAPQVDAEAAVEALRVLGLGQEEAEVELEAAAPTLAGHTFDVNRLLDDDESEAAVHPLNVHPEPEPPRRRVAPPRRPA